MNLGNCLSYAVVMVNGSEGFTASAFLDTLAKPPVWTIGHGTTRIAGQLVVKGATCTKIQADLWAMNDMMGTAHYVLSKVTVPLNEYQLAALISFCYNVGMGNFLHSSVLAALNAGRARAAADRLLEYDEAGGHVIKGLETRRARERALFLMGMGIYAPPPLPGIDPPVSLAAVTPTDVDDADALNQGQLDRLNGAEPATGA